MSSFPALARTQEGQRDAAGEGADLDELCRRLAVVLGNAEVRRRVEPAVLEALRRSVGDERAVTADPLTGLATRRVVLDRIEQLLSGPQVADGVAVLFVDLDRFKLVNDSLGHEAGDRVLATTAGRLRQSVRPGDLVGRLSGDEFVVVCIGLHGEVDALGLADRICRELAGPISLAGRDVVITASIGIARGVAGTAAEGLLRDADVAMYQAKARGRDRVELFGRSMRARLMERVELESDLRRAVATNGFRLHFQPSVSLENGRPLLVEALLRWDDPDRGMVPPAQFIPVAEDTRLIVPIGAWVLREACRELAKWRREHPALASMEVAVNLSACQFQDPRLVDTVRDALADAGLDPSALWLEITEGVVMEAVTTTIETLGQLRDLGVRIAIDDFGTGYSSLSYLKRLPADVLKIDRSFVDGLPDDTEDEAIVTAVVRMAQALGKRVVAEGVETGDQCRILRDLGCDVGQGYLFSRPQPPETVVPWLVRELTQAAPTT